MLALPLVLGGWAFLSFLFASVVAAGDPSANAPTILRIANIVLGFLGIANIIMVPVGLIVGIVILVKKDETIPPTEPPVQPPTTSQPV